MPLQLSRAFAILALLPFALGAIYEDVTQLHDLNYDYVVVGAGTAGLTVASRLSTVPGLKVLVLEAGVSDVGQLPLEVPLLSVTAAPGTQYDWNYTTTAQTGLVNRTLPYSRGFVLGGSSSINYMVYNTGSKDDWDFYAKISGEPSWSWANMSSYRSGNEHWTLPSSGRNITGEYLPSAHSERGAVNTSLPSHVWPSDTRALQATQQQPQEFPFVLDMNAGNPLGVGYTSTSISNGTRVSSSTAYLHPVIDSRPHLDVLLHAHASKLVKTSTQNGLPVIGAVNFVFKGKTYTVKAKKEVIVSAGSFGTPQLLLLSGIGASAELKAANIPTLVNLPSVGKNMSDHVVTSTVFQTTSNDTWGDYLGPAVVDTQLAKYSATKQGGLSDEVCNILGWLRLPSNDTMLKKNGDPSNGPTSAHYELVFLEDDGLASGFAPPANGSVLTVGVAVISPTSRGTVSLNNSSPLSAPLINPNWLTTEQDMYIMQYGINAARRLMSAPAWKGYLVGPYADFANATTPATLEAYIRKHAGTVWHAAGTAGMSARNASYGVVNPDLLVKNTVGLRIVDASVLPRVPTAHPQAVIYAFALRAADLAAAAANLKLATI